MKKLKTDCQVRLLIILVIGVSFIYCVSRARADSAIRADGTLSFLDADGNIQASIVIEIARTEGECSKGLMERQTLGENEGMLFVYDKLGDRFFWMRNTYVSLDSIFVSATSQIIYIARETESLTETRHWSKGPAQYVVEVVGGFSERHGITSDSRITWRKNTE